MKTLIISGNITHLSHLPAGVECLLQVFFPMSFAPLTFSLFREACKLVPAIVLYLIGVVCNDALWLAECPCDAELHAAVAVAVVSLRCSVHGLNQNHQHLLWGSHAVVVI